MIGENSASRERGDRSLGREYLLEPQFGPERDDITTAELCDYFGTSRSTIVVMLSRHRYELTAMGYRDGAAETRRPGRWTRRAALHAAMLLQPRPGTRARDLQIALGTYTDPESAYHYTPAHARMCRTELERAIGLVTTVREESPMSLWHELADLDRWQMHALVVALAAMVPPDTTVKELHDYLNALGGNKRSAIKGLCALVPPRQIIEKQNRKAG